jgi:hypothetical protein
MSQPKFVSLCRRVVADLEAHYDGKPRKLYDALYDLLSLVLTSELPDRLELLVDEKEVRGLKTHITALQTLLRRRSYIPEAFCARYEYNQSERKVKNDWGITETEWDFVHGLARDVIPVEDLYRRLDLSQYDWHDRLEEGIVFVDVAFDERSLEDLLLPVMEAYLSPKEGKRKGYEVYGICLGMRNERPEKKRGKGVTITQHVRIMRCQPQLSAEGTTYSVHWRMKSINALIEASRTLFPWFDLVGEFHSHPYESLSRLVEKRGWELSEQDVYDLTAWYRHMRTLQQRPVVALVAGIAKSDRVVERTHFKDIENTLELSAGGCRFIIKAYRILGSGKVSEMNIRLRAMGMV